MLLNPESSETLVLIVKKSVSHRVIKPVILLITEVTLLILFVFLQKILAKPAL